MTQKYSRTPWARVKKFILQTIRCPQKKFVVEGEVFTDARPTAVRNNMVGFNDNHVLKVENFAHRGKTNDLRKEAAIIKHLNEHGCVCCPKLVKEGTLGDKRHYIILERLVKGGRYTIADALLGVLELQSLGVFHGDAKVDNIIFDGTIAKFIDYDQSEIREPLKALRGQESVKIFIDSLSKRWGDGHLQVLYGVKNAEAAIKKVKKYFPQGVFDLENTVIYKKLKKTSPGKEVFYGINAQGVSANGKYGINDFAPVLNELAFKNEEKVLDFGCSLGALSFYLKERGCVVDGCDTNEYAILLAKMLSNIMGLKCSFFHQEYLKKEYDTVFILNTVNFLENMDKNIEYVSKNSKHIIVRCDGQNFSSKSLQGLFPEFRIEKTWKDKGGDDLVSLVKV